MFNPMQNLEITAPRLYICTAAILVVCATLLSRPRIRRDGRALPTLPGTLPLAGYGLWFLRPRHVLLAWFGELAPRMRLETYELPVPSLPPAVLVNDPALLAQVLRGDGGRDNSNNNNKNGRGDGGRDPFAKGAFFRARSADLFRDGILNADGHLWRVQRKAGLRFLSRPNLRRFVDDVLPGLVRDLKTRLDDAAATAGVVVDLQQELLELTTQFMGRIAYGMEMSGDMPFARAFDLASAETGRRFTNPLWKVKDWFFGAELRRAIAKVHDFGEEIVNAAKEGREERKSGRETVNGAEHVETVLQTNLIDSLLDHIPSAETVSAAAVNFLSAGRDTTAQSMTWTIYCLSRHPKKLERLRQSLQASFSNQDRSDNLQLRYDDVSNPVNYSYLSAVFAETLRLYPVIPFEIKETTTKVTLEDGTLLPEGAVVIWIPFSMARNPAIWGSDAAKFRPERWIDGLKENVSYRYQDGQESEEKGSVDFSKAEFLPNMKTAFENPVFNAGARMCIGKQLAEALASVVIADLIWTYDFAEVRGKGEINGERVGQDSLTMPMLGGFPVRVSRRMHL